MSEDLRSGILKYYEEFLSKRNKSNQFNFRNWLNKNYNLNGSNLNKLEFDLVKDITKANRDIIEDGGRKLIPSQLIFDNHYEVNNAKNKFLGNKIKTQPLPKSNPVDTPKSDVPKEGVIGANIDIPNNKELTQNKNTFVEGEIFDEDPIPSTTLAPPKETSLAPPKETSLAPPKETSLAPPKETSLAQTNVTTLEESSKADDEGEFGDVKNADKESFDAKKTFQIIALIRNGILSMDEARSILKLPPQKDTQIIPAQNAPETPLVTKDVNPEVKKALEVAEESVKRPIQVNVVNNSRVSDFDSIKKNGSKGSAFKSTKDEKLKSATDDVETIEGTDFYTPTKFPFIQGIYGVKRSGKSYYIKRWLEMVSNGFDKIILFSSTALANKEYDEIRYSHTDFQIFDKVTDKDLSSLLALKKGSMEDQWLIIFDDFIGMFNPHRSKPFETIVTSARHLNISMIMLSQKITKTPPVFRDNQESMVIFKMSAKEYAFLWKEFGPDVNGKEFVRTLRLVTSQQGQAVVYDPWFKGVGAWLIVKNNKVLRILWKDVSDVNIKNTF